MITGANFMSGATVSFGGTAATGVTVASGASITATTPAHAAGAVTVAVTNTDSQSGSLTGGYTYASNSSTSSLGLGVASGGSASATVVAGQTASYAVSIGGKGESGTASLSCTGAPTGATCSLPASETLSATAPQTFSVSVATTSRTVGELHPYISAPVPWLWAVAVMGIIGWPGIRMPRRSTRRYFWLAPLLLLSFLVSCGSGSSGTQSTPSSKGTPAGTYVLTVKATSAAATETTSLTLSVR